MWNSACRELTANGKILGQSLEAKVREQAQLVYDKSEELSKIQEYLDAVRDRVVKILGDTGFRVSVTSSLDSLLSMMESPEFTGVSRGGAVRVVGGEKSSDRDRLLVRIKRLSSEMEDFRVLARLAASCVFGSGSVLGNEMLREALEELGYGEEDGS